jgi:hypothetical protein
MDLRQTDVAVRDVKWDSGFEGFRGSQKKRLRDSGIKNKAVVKFHFKFQALAVCAALMTFATTGWGQISENFQNWTSRGAYGAYSQAGSGGTWGMVDAIVAPTASASGTGSAGLIQLKSGTGILSLPTITSGGVGTITIQARVSSTSGGFSVEKSINGTTWTVVQSFTSSSTTGVQFQASVNDSSSNLQIRINNTGGSSSRVLYVHDVVTTTSGASSPSSQATSFTSSSITSSSATVGWTRGNGTAGVLVVARASGAVNTDPTDGNTYTADAAFGSGTQVGTGNYVVYKGTGTSVSVTGLSPSTAYHFAIYEYNTTGTMHNMTELTGNLTTSAAALPNGPNLTAAGSATVDGAFDVTFTDSSAWRSAITSITVGGTTLSASAYTVATGKITFTPSASTLLQSSVSKSIAVIATGYNNATVTQAIGAGAANKLAITTQPTAPASNGAVLATQPIVALQDRYGNATTSTATVNAAVEAGTWTIGGTTGRAAVSGTATFSGLTATSAAAVSNATITFTSGSLTSATSSGFNIPVPPPANDLSSAPTSITVNGESVSGTTLAATLSSPFTTPTGSTDVWFSLTAPATGTITVATSTTAQNLDLTVWSGSAPSATTGTVMTNGAASISTTSEAGTFSATAGTIYYIRVLKYNSADTAGSFTITAKTLPYPMASGNYLQDFTDIADWTDNFTSTTGAVNYLSVAVNNTGSIPDGAKTTVSSATFTTSQSGGIQKGTGNLLFLSTGTTSNGNSLAVDLPLDFSGRVAGTISFDWACVFNSTGNRGGTLSVYTSTDGTTWTLLSGTSVSVVNNVASSGTVSTIQLPSSFNNNANARVRFYQYADAVGTTGSRPKISLDNLAVTSTAIPAITIGGNTSATATAFTTSYGTPSGNQSFVIAGSNLTANISVGAVTGFEYSIDGGSTWGTTRTITQSSGSASATLLVRLAATAVVGGSYDSQAIPLSSTGATTRNINTASTGNSVSKATPTISAAPTASAITYGQTLASSSLTGGTPSTPGSFAFTTPSTAPNAGTASQNVTFTPNDTVNYNTASTTVSVTVNTKAITVTADAKSKAYGAEDPGLTYAITSGALVVGDSLTGGLSRAAGENVGTYAISSTLANANYDVTFVPANLTITAATVASGDITLTPAGDGSYTASATGGASFTYSYVGRSANGITTSYSSATAPTAAGYYTVSATATGNYSGSNTADYFVAGPVAVDDPTRTKSAGIAAQLIPISELLANDRRITSTGTVETTGLTLTGVTNGSGNTEIAGVFIKFTPSSAATDTFTYTVSDGTKSATATVTITTETQAPSFDLQIVKVGTADFAGGNTTVTHDFIGVPGQTYLVEYKTNLQADWTSAGNQDTGATGSFSVTFTKSGDVVADWNAHMFFRARLVP